MSYAKRLIISLISARLSLLLLLITVTVIISYIFLIYINYSLENITPVSVSLLTNIRAVRII